MRIKNIFKKILISVSGLLQGSIGNYIGLLLGIAFAFPTTKPGEKDYEEDMSTVPIGFLLIIIWLIVTASVFISLRKNKANLLIFIISWVIGLISFCGLLIFLW